MPDIFDKSHSVQVQINNEKTSRSFTIHNTTVEDIHSRVYAFLKALENTPKNEIKIVARKWLVME